MNRRLREHRLAVASFVLFGAAWAAALPVGVLGRRSTTIEVIEEAPAASGAPRRTVAVSLERTVRAYGPVRARSTAWAATASPTPARGPLEVTTLEVTEALRAEFLRQRPREAGDLELNHDGWWIAWGELAERSLAAMVLVLLTCAWWVAVRRSRLDLARPGHAIATSLALALWPWLIGARAALHLYDEAGRPRPTSPVLVGPDHMLVGTVFLIAVGLVLLLRPRDAGEAEGP